MFLTFPAFSAGELTPLLDGRSDLAALKMGCRLARNMIPQRLGGMLQRPGFYKRGLAREQGASRVSTIPFVASADFAYVIEVGPTYFRFWYNNSLVITTADNAGRPGVISAVGDPLILATPYDAASLFELQWAHANDVMWIAHPRYPVYKLTRYAVDGFYFEPMTFVFPPLRDMNVDEITLAASGTLTVGGTVTLTAAGGDVFVPVLDVGAYYGIDHRRAMPFAEISLSQGSGTATALLIFSGNAVAAETVTVGSGTNVRTYTWDGSGPYGVPVGGTTADSVKSLTDAFNGATGVHPGTLAHPQVTAENLGSFAAGTKASGVLSFTDNALTSGTPDEFIIGSQHYYYSDDVTSGAAYGVKRGATLADSIANAILATNASGTPGVNYTAGTAANVDVTVDAAAIGSSMRVQAIAAGVAGNDIVTDVDHTSRMSWANSTLTGGADGSTYQIQITARIEGLAGNSIATAETMTNADWQPSTGFMAGGADNTNYDPANPAAVIPTVRVDGTWEVYTLGRWYGTLTLEQQRTTGEWEAVRTWDSQNDRNVQATGTVDGEKLMRLIFVGAGIADDTAPARAVLTATDAIVHGLVLITAVADATHATGTVINEIWSTEPTYLWSHGSWNDRFGYPAAVVLHQQRLTFGQGSRIIGSQAGGFDNFLRNELADSSYQYDLAATIATNIVSMQSQQGLIILTETDEWLADGGQTGAVISPTGIRTQQLSTYGSTRATSQIIHNNVVFIQSGGLILNEYLFNFGQQNYEAVNLVELADHLADEILVQTAWAPVPHSLVYCVTREGSLLSMAYRRQAGTANEGGQLAWTKHTAVDGEFESVCVIPGSNEVSDVWVVIRRELPDGSFVRTLESFDILYWDTLKTPAAISELCLSDGAVKKEAFLPVDPVVTGLDHLEGMTVNVLLNGSVHGQRVVVGGEITLDMTSVTGVSTAIVGVPVTAQLQPFFAIVGMRDGGGDGRTYKVSKYDVRFYLSGAAEYADDNETAPFFPVNFRTGADPINAPTPLFTGLLKLDGAGSYRNMTKFIFTNGNPLPMNILGITAELSIHS
jgi:hypothetical protein